MKKFITYLLFLFAASSSVMAQNYSDNLKTAELFSPMNIKGKHDPVTAQKSCFSFIKDAIGGGPFCVKSDLYYGGMRLGNNWDWFQAMGAGSRNRIVRLGKKNWTDDIKIPIVNAYAKLKEGEQRHIVVDTSGEDGKDGKDGEPGKNGENGRNFDGTYNSNPIQVSENLSQSAIDNTKKTKSKVKSDYHPFEEAVLGNMYVMRVVDESNDFYVLFRIEELERGKRSKISWKKVDAPIEK